MNPLYPHRTSGNYNPWGVYSNDDDKRHPGRRYKGNTAEFSKLVVPLVKAIAGITLLGIGTTHSCAADTEGSANPFDIKGHVISSDGVLTRMKVVEVITAEGTAARIDVGDTIPVYTEYMDDDCDEQVVGVVETFATRPNETDDHLVPGDYVQANGTRHDSFRDCDARDPKYGARNVAVMIATYPA